MELLKLSDICRATSGILLKGYPGLGVKGLFTDTRTPLKGGLFVAIRGINFDGHAFLDKAIKGGAAVLLISEMEKGQALLEKCSAGIVVVRDTRKAFLELASFYRNTLGVPHWYGITGSTGKSTVKEMLAHILQKGNGWRVHRAAKSFNNDIGLPTTILGVETKHHAAVLELGTNFPGEISLLAKVARPTVAVITNAGPVHLAGLGSLEGVVEEKGAILDVQGSHDWAILNRDDPAFETWRLRARGLVKTFGVREQADVQALDIKNIPSGGVRFILRLDSQQEEVQLGLPGRHNVYNTLAAAAAALTVGVSTASIADAMRSFAGIPRRLQLLNVNGVKIIDDAYNANPESFKAALDVLAGYRGRRKFIVVGDMLELGREAKRYHRALGSRLADLSPYALFTVGSMAEQAGMAAVEAGLPSEAWTRCASSEDAAKRLRAELQAGDIALIKGSNGVGLDVCVRRLMERASVAAV